MTAILEHGAPSRIRLSSRCLVAVCVLSDAQVQGEKQLGGQATRRDEMRIEPAVALRVTEALAIEPQHLPPSPFEHCLGSRRVPLAGGGKARVQVGFAFGQQAELQRAADINQIDLLQGFEAVQQGFLLGTGMPSADR